MTGCQIHAKIRARAVGPVVCDITVIPTNLAHGTFELVIDDRNRTLRKFQLARAGGGESPSPPSRENGL